MNINFVNIKNRKALRCRLLVMTFSIGLLAVVLVRPLLAAQSEEMQLKSAFLYNFIKFVDWPQKKFEDSNSAVIIGVIAKDPLGDAFKPLIGKKVKNRTVVVKHLTGFDDLNQSRKQNNSEPNEIAASLRECHLLFICSAENRNISKIIDSIKDCNVLIVGEQTGFLETGGMINFLIENNKVRFEINLDAAEKEELKMNSQLLQLAKRVIKQKPKPGKTGK